MKIRRQSTSRPQDGSERFRPSDGLTKCQLEVLGMIGDELNTKTMAAATRRSPKTIESHRSRLYEIFNTRSQVKLAKIAIAFGLSSLCVVLLVGCVSSPSKPASSPSKPTTAVPMLLAKPTKFTTVTMGWNPVNGATNYVLAWGTSVPYNNALSTSGTQVRLSGLAANTVYHFAVRCMVNGTNSDLSPDVAWKSIVWHGNAPAPIQ